MSLEKVIDDKISDLLIKIDKQKLPKHVAIIMDGNGRWATRKGLPRSFGHKQGVTVLKKILKVAKNLGCKVITVYAFSTENWTRPTKEVDFLINLFSEVLKNEIREIHEESTKIKFIGDLTPFPENLKKIISAGVILPLSRQGISRYGTRHLAALGITERFDRCICIVVSEETGTLSLANQGKLERPITSSRLQELLVNLIGNQNTIGTNKSSLGKNSLSQNTNLSDTIVTETKGKDTENPAISINKND